MSRRARTVRVAHFVLALLALVATATPVAAHDADHPEASPAELAAMVESAPDVTARAVDAHLIEEWHEAHGHHRWRMGRGHWGHSWATFQVQARQLRAYLLSQDESVRRFALVLRWAKVADCESSGNWAIDSGNGYYGGLQFSMGTWRAYGGEGRPEHQPNWYQAQIADHVRVRSGLHHWPVCGRYYRG